LFRRCGPALPDARAQWSDGRAYDRAAEDLSARFRKNFEKFGAVEEDILEAAPLAG
jgi:ATP-dependent phosphoenolpyruvate carboxykinase